MKLLKFQFVILFFVSISLYAQTPNGFNYQAVAREANGNPVSDKQISVRFTILQGSADGNILYMEYHKVKTSDIGTFSAVIGTGIVKEGDFNTIDWSQGDMFIKVDFDPEGDENYVEMGTQKLFAVPYAMYALNGKKGDRGEKGEKGDKGDRGEPGKQGEPGPSYTAGEGIYIVENKISAEDDSPSNEIQQLKLSGTKLSISKGNSVTLPSGGSGASKINDLDDGKTNDNGTSLYLGNDAGKEDDLSDGNNTGIGSKALSNNSSGKYNTALGNISLFTNTEGSFNTATGSGALAGNNKGENNTANGANALLFNSTGNNNTAVGNIALHINTTGSNNVAVGYSTLKRNTVKSGLVAVGDSALCNNGAGATKSYHALKNTALGSKTLANNTYGYDNTATGSQTLYSNTAGSHNSAYGVKSMYANETGKYNTAYGHSSLISNTTGNNNTAIGYQALLFNNEGSENTAIGRGAGFTNVSGKGNVFIGNNAGLFETGSNKLYIENSNAKSTDALIYGEFDNNMVRINGKLEVDGQIKIASSNATAEAGMIRWNNTTSDFEGFNGTEWVSFTKTGNWGQSTSTAIENSSIVATDGAALDYFGWGASISGDYAVIGAGGDNIDDISNQGSAYIFKHNGGNWVQQAKLTASDGEKSDYFGNSVSISGDYAVVGAINDDIDDKSDQGSAYIFKRNGGNWIQQAKLTASDGKQEDHFGNNVSISGDYVVIGAKNDNIDDKNNQGSAYIFKRNGTNWVQQAKLTASDGKQDDYFGNSVSILDDYVVVGAIDDDVNSTSNQGSAYIFKRNGTNWVQQAKLTASDGEQDDHFGNSVSISEDYIIVGAKNDEIDGKLGQGSAYVFKRVGANWVQQAKLTSPDLTENAAFGFGVSISGDYAVVGARNDDIYGIEAQGSAFVFKRNGENWVQQVKLTASDGSEYAFFGEVVCIEGDNIIVSSPEKSLGNDKKGAGKVYFYKKN